MDTMQTVNMNEDNSTEVFLIPRGGDGSKMEFVKYSDFLEVSAKLEALQNKSKDCFFAGFELSKFFPSDTDISKKWDEYRDSLSGCNEEI